MQSNETQGKEQEKQGEQKKGLLRRPIKIWKLTLPLWLVAIGGCCILSVAIGGIGSLFEGAEELPTPTSIPTDTPIPAPTETGAPTETPAPTDTPSPTFTPGPTNTPEPTDTPAPPTETPSPEQAIERIVEDTLGTCNRDVQRIQELRVANDGWVHIKWAINDNLTEGMIKNGAKLDVTEVAEALCEAGYCNGLTMRGTFSMVDQYGNTSEDVVVEVVLSPGTLDKINWENFLFENIYAIADSANIHPAFQN
jgi:hypothetical protein